MDSSGQGVLLPLTLYADQSLLAAAEHEVLQAGKQQKEEKLKHFWLRA
jgi:hypothetical protein